MSKSETMAVAEAGQRTWERRGLFAAAAAAMAGVVARVTTRSAEAANGGNVILGTNNSEFTETVVTNTSPGGTALGGTCLFGDDGWGLEGIGSGFGVIGRATTSGGVPDGAGVYGESSLGSGAAGVSGLGMGNTPGVKGASAMGNGVVGSTGAGAGVVGTVAGTANGIGVYGFNSSTYAGASSGAGGFGFYGGSAKGHGVFGNAMVAGAGAVVGYNSGVAGCYAGLLYGPVVVQGNFTVAGGAKSAAVPHPDGTHRRLYCVEAPESWFEDFGKGQLACGQAEVCIDPDFAAVANLDDYHVFLTAYDAGHLLHVSDQTAGGFTVNAKDAAASGRFSWRVVAKRKDIAGPRFETVEIPRVPDVPAMPETPTPEPRQPGARRH